MGCAGTWARVPDRGPEVRLTQGATPRRPAVRQPGGRARGPLVPFASRVTRSADVFYSVPRAPLRLSQPSPPQVGPPVTTGGLASGRLGLARLCAFQLL